MALTHSSFWRRLVPIAVLGVLLTSLAPAQKLFVWGRDDAGRLNPPAATKSRVTATVAGSNHNAAVQNGGVVVWGGNTTYQTPPVEAQSGVSAVAVGEEHTLALKGGKVLAWGDDWRGLGFLDVPAEALSGVSAIGAGGYQSFALKNGKVLSWGVPYTDSSGNPISVPSEAQAGVTAIAVSPNHTLALKDGGVLAWGSNFFGETSVPSAAQSGVTAIAAGINNSLALKNGGVLEWGNTAGPVPTAAQSGVVAIASGNGFNLALKANGTIVTWGFADFGETTVPAGPQGSYVGIAAGPFYASALQAEAWATLDQTEVFSTYAAQGTVHLADAAPAGGADVALESDKPGIVVPPTVHVAAGATTATFPVTTEATFVDVDGTIKATYNGSATVAAPLKVKCIPVSVGFNHPSVIGGSTTSLKTSVSIAFALPFDVTFSLSSSDPDVLSVPGNITIPAGQTTASVPVVHNYACGCSPETVTASFLGIPIAVGSVAVEPVKATVTLESASILSGYYTFGFVTLNTTLRAPLDVYTCGCDPDIYMPDVVRINAKARTAFFPILSNPVARSYTTLIGVLVNDGFFTAPLKIVAAPSVRSIAAPSGMYGNGKITVTVQLNKAAGPDGQDVYLSSSDDALTIPEYVTVPEGATTASFEAFSSDVSATLPVVITAETDVSTLTRPLTLRPLVPAAVTLSSTSVVGGGSVTGTVTLKAAVAVDTEVPLSSSNPLVTVPATVIVPAGSKSATFTVQTSHPTKATGVKVIATLNGVAVSATVKVNP